jgi:hypothetical protein
MGFSSVDEAAHEHTACHINSAGLLRRRGYVASCGQEKHQGPLVFIRLLSQGRVRPRSALPRGSSARASSLLLQSRREKWKELQDDRRTAGRLRATVLSVATGRLERPGRQHARRAKDGGESRATVVNTKPPASPWLGGFVRMLVLSSGADAGKGNRHTPGVQASAPGHPSELPLPCPGSPYRASDPRCSRFAVPVGPPFAFALQAERGI